MNQIGDGIAVLFAAPHAKRSGDSYNEYRTCSNFYYLTGFHEESAIAIFQPKSDKPFRLFVLPNDAIAEMWEGKRVGVDGAKNLYGADACFPVEQFDEIFKTLLKQTQSLYYQMGDYGEIDTRIQDILRNHRPNLRTGDKEFCEAKKVQPIIAKMRMVKDIEEVALMRKCAQNTSFAHRQTMAATKPGMFEYQIEAEIEYWFRHGGAESLAYSSIVAGGNNANILHYKTNRDQLHGGDLLLIDAGGEMNLYTSDITRTFPINGKFTAAQKTIYGLVLNAQKRAIEMIKPGVKFSEVHMAATEVLVDGLLELGFLKGNRTEILSDKKNYSSFYPHNTSHWLGLDVHDAGIYFVENNESIPLEAGNVLTVEPGLYIGKDRTDVPEEYRGIGIRIEDDVLVTMTGYDVLTKDCPKEISDIEAIVGNSKELKSAMSWENVIPS